MSFGGWTNPDTGSVFNYDASGNPSQGGGYNMGGYNAGGYNAGSGGGLGMATGLAGLAGGIGQSLFGANGNPANSANQYLSQIPQTLQNAFQPFINQGATTGATTNNLYNQLATNPGGFSNQIGSNYQQSPGYNFALKQGLMGSNNAAAAGGMLGSPANQQQNSQIAAGYANQDYGNYMNRALSLFGTGAQGNENTLNRGYGAASNMGQDLSTLFGAQGQYAAQQTAGQNATQNNDMSQIFSGAASLLPSLFSLF